MTTQIAKPIRLVTRAETLDEKIRFAELMHKVLCLRTRRPSSNAVPTFRRDQPLPTLTDTAALVIQCERHRGPKR